MLTWNQMTSDEQIELLQAQVRNLAGDLAQARAELEDATNRALNRTYSRLDRISEELEAITKRGQPESG